MRRALVVDDTAIMRVIVSRILRDSEFDIIEAYERRRRDPALL